MYHNGHWYKHSGKFLFRKCHFQKEMSSWGPGFIQKKGHMILPYYHFVGFGDYADEFFKMVRSAYYSYQAKEFLFVFDKVNSVSGSFCLFESTLKRNTYSRFLPYYPSTGFNLGERHDLLNPVLQRLPIIDTLSFFQVFSAMFQLQDSMKPKIIQLYQRKDHSPVDQFQVGLCLLNGETNFTPILEKITRFAERPIDPLTVFVSCSSRDQYNQFRDQCPSQWKLLSMWDVLAPTIVTEEQKLETLYASIGSLIFLSNVVHLVGSFKHSAFRFVYCKEQRFRTPSNLTILDGSSFSYF
jgi:hypothetical protein